ncbi:hypothetical protein T06_7096 [Trichinella sp. T6]|nr:hypothetical protein T06_7096 [Trichinella sp. T6]
MVRNERTDSFFKKLSDKYARRRLFNYPISTLPPNNAIAFWRLWKNESSSSVDQRRHHQQLVIEKRFYHRLQSALSKRDTRVLSPPPPRIRGATSFSTTRCRYIVGA